MKSVGGLDDLSSEGCGNVWREGEGGGYLCYSRGVVWTHLEGTGGDLAWSYENT